MKLINKEVLLPLYSSKNLFVLHTTLLIDDRHDVVYNFFEESFCLLLYPVFVYMCIPFLFIVFFYLFTSVKIKICFD